jgi:hypothetical protein
MRITFKPTVDDYMRASGFLTRRSRWYPVRIMAALLLAALAGVYLYVVTGSPVGLAYIVVAGLVLALPWSRRQMAARRLALTPDALSIVTLALGPGGLQVVTSGTRTTIPWAAVLEIHELRDQVLFRTSRAQARYVPGNAFATPDDRAAFVAAAREYRRAAMEGTPANIVAPQVWPPVPDAGQDPVAETIAEYPTRLDVEDYRRYVAALPNDWTVWRMYLFALIFVLLGAFVAVVMPGWGKLGVVVFAWFPVLIVLNNVPATQRWLLRRQLAAAPGALGPRTIVLRPPGVLIVTPVGQSEYAWTQFRELRETPHLILFMIRPRYGVLIPKRDFPDSNAASVFLETARALRSAAGP